MRAAIDTLEARSIEPSEYESFFRTACTAFGEEPRTTTMEAEQPAVEFDRSFVAFDGPTPVATTAALTMDVTVPGGALLPMGGLSWVATLPGYTRRGLLTGLMRGQLRDMQDRDEMIAGLWASESTIYGRYGFGPSTWNLGFQVPKAHARLRESALHPAQPASRGTVRLVEVEAARALLPRIYDQYGRADAGSLGRPHGWWHVHLADVEEHRDGGGPLYHAVHHGYETRAADETHANPAGYVSYRIIQKWDQGIPRCTLRVEQLVASQPAVYADLWRYCLAIDLVETLAGAARPLDEPLRWMIRDSRRLEATKLSDALWLRPLRVQPCLEQRSYAASGRVVLQIDDPFLGAAHGRYLLEATPEGASCSRTRRAADLHMDVSVLASAYLGAVSYAGLAAAGRVIELRPGALAQADALFAVTRQPFCATDF